MSGESQKKFSCKRVDNHNMNSQAVWNKWRGRLLLSLLSLNGGAAMMCKLTYPMRLSVVCSDPSVLTTKICDITAVKMLWSHGAQLIESTTDLLFYHNINVQDRVFVRAWPRSWHKKRASVVHSYFSIGLVYSGPKKSVTAANSYHKNSESSEATVNCRTLNKRIQHQLFSYWKYSSRIIMLLRQNMHIGICIV